MSESHLSSEKRVCHVEGCGKPAANGWRICEEHVEQRHSGLRCKHGNSDKSCIECLVESLREEGCSKPYTLPENDLVSLTAVLSEHPDWWDHPCMCAECRSHGDG
jgi:hypothetical protein